MWGDEIGLYTPKNTTPTTSFKCMTSYGIGGSKGVMIIQEAGWRSLLNCAFFVLNMTRRGASYGTTKQYSDLGKMLRMDRVGTNGG